MRLTVLVDNNTYIDRYYLGEPAFSCWIEDGEERILFDTGYSDVLLRNAKSLGISLASATKIALSHGHNDHTGGLRYLRDAGLLQDVEIIAHPDCFRPKRLEGQLIGSPFTEEELARECRCLTLTAAPLQLGEHTLFLGEIPSQNTFEQKGTIGEVLTEEGWTPDRIREDTSLCLKTKEGIFLVTGCSHSGVCNMVSHLKSVTGEDHLSGVLGGFHLLSEDAPTVCTADYLAAAGVPVVYPCHCVSLAAKTMLNRELPVREVGVGLSLEWD